MEVPQALREKPNWVLWRNEDGRKIPYQSNGQKARTNDPKTWTTFDTAHLAVGSDYSGIGFVFDGSGIFGIDLDGCIVDGVEEPCAREIIDDFRTFAEISPSGTGVHIYGLGMIPDGKGRKNDTIEIYDRGRYFCFTSDALADSVTYLTDCQDALDRLLARYWPPKPIPKFAPLPTPRTDIAERATRYLATIPGAVSGNSGHNATFRAACVLVLGFKLTPDEAYPLLAEWNQTCEPPWTEKELWHKLHDADKKEGPRGWLLEDREYEGTDVDLRMLLANLPNKQEKPEPPTPEIKFPVECIEDMPWLMRLAYDYTMQKAIKPQPELTLAALIAMFGAILGRKVCDDYGTRSNIMMLGLAPSGSGKEHPRKVVKEILFRCGLDLINGPERVGSHAGIVSSVDKHPVRLFQLDEIGRLLHTMREPKASHLYNIGTVLMQLFSSADTIWTGDAYADLNKVKRINQPCVCIFGTSGPNAFYSGLSIENLSDGLLARMIVVESNGHVERKKPIAVDMPQELIDGIARWCQPDTTGGNLADLNPQPMVIAKTPEANSRHEKYANIVNDKHAYDNAEEAAIWSRAPEKAAKLALIHACCQEGEEMPVIADRKSVV